MLTIIKRSFKKRKQIRSNLLFLFLSVLLPSVLSAQVDSINGIPIEFELQRTLQAGERGVGLNGTFNNWGEFYNRHPYVLKNTGDNRWTITVPLLADSARNYTYYGAGFYEYKFVTYSISGADTSITSWITDPYNPRNDPLDNNNSILYITDPYIYRLQPKDGLVTKEKTPFITGKIAVGRQNHLNISTLRLEIDGIEIPNSPDYYDSTEHLFNYQITTPLGLGKHKIKLSVMNDKGFVGADSSSFTISNLILSAPYEFVFDPLSPSLKFLGDSISTVSIQGAFNNYGADPLSGPDEDGIFKLKEILPIGSKITYQYIVKGASAPTAYLYDPDNPRLGSDYNPFVIKQVVTVPVINIISPHQGTIFTYPTGVINIAAFISPNDSNTVIDNSSIKVYLDDNQISFTNVADTINNGFEINSTVNDLSIGRHILRFTGKDIHGNTAQTKYLTIGVFSSNTGYHYIDAQNDDDGTGNYTYPPQVAAHAVDIQSIYINTNSGNDSLQLTITMGAIDDYSRVAFEILNELNSNYIDAPFNAGIKIPEWNNYGVYFIIADPNSAQLSGNENVIYVSSNPLQKTSSIKINANAKSISQFKFSIALSDLENIMGSFTSKWYLGAYSYLGNTNGAIKVDGTLGGSSLNGNPNIYDAAFFRNDMIQHRILSNYILPYFVGGPKPIKIGTENRGFISITPDQISTSLAQQPTVKLLTNGGDWYEDTVRVYGQVNDNSITSAIFHIKNGGLSFDTTVTVTNGIFAGILVLYDGENVINASVNKNSQESVSKNIRFRYYADFSTSINIKYNISNKNVTLDASNSKNQYNLPISFSWQPDPANPAPVTLTNTNSSITSYTSPSVDGEYYFILKVTNSKDTSWARALVIVNSGLPDTVNLETWHSKWIDKAVVYEIYPRSFSFAGNLANIIPQLQRLKNLGINCIWLMPIMPAASPHGYNITDYYNINPDYGTKQDFKNLIAAAHQKGIRIMMDLVINHTSAVHPFMEDAYKFKQYSPYYNFYDWDLKGNYEFLSNWWDLPNINYEEKWVRDYLIRMITYWVEGFDIDGYRCDVAWGVNDTRTSGPSFWQRFRNTLKNIKPDIFLLAEAQSDQLKYFNDKFDAGYDWPLFNKLKDVINHNSGISSLDSLIQWYQGPNYLSYIRPFRFLENHDEDRFISKFSPEQTKSAASILLTLPGVPLIYSGQETGETTQRDMISWNDIFNLQVFYQKLILGRDNNPALQQGSFTRLSNSSPDSVYSFMRISGNNRALVINNLYGNNIHLNVSILLDSLRLDINKTWYANDILNITSAQIDPATFNNYTVDLSSYESKIIILDNSPFTDIKEKNQQPLTYRLNQNYPNPFNPSTTILYEIPNTEKVTLEIYDILGRRVKTLVNTIQQQGRYSITWNGRNSFSETVASGIYFYRLQSGNFINVKKMVMLK